ncbi:MAG: MBOAT family O-acyltransferase, partial [Planctomycetota bacterium]
FPQLIAGPIVHHHEMMPQFRPESSDETTSQRVAIGGTMFTLGLAKKVLIADTFAELATPTFDLAATGATPAMSLAWIGVLAYTLQIYFDFSGYSDMAIGLARLFGIRLPANFASPYQSRSISEFWRRWHMTLSRFLRDYLYIPLGGNRRGPARRYLNLTLTMLLGGLWHGAGWTFVAWGGLHGAYLVIHHAWERFRPLPLPGPVAQAITLAGVMLAWIFFRAVDFESAARMLSALVGGGGSVLPEVATLENFLWIAVGFGIALWAPNSQCWLRGYRPVLEEPVDALPLRGGWRPTPVHAMLVAALFIFSVMRITRYSEFIYFQF